MGGSATVGRELTDLNWDGVLSKVEVKALGIAAGIDEKDANRDDTVDRFRDCGSRFSINGQQFDVMEANKDDVDDKFELASQTKDGGHRTWSGHNGVTP